MSGCSFLFWSEFKYGDEFEEREEFLSTESIVPEVFLEISTHYAGHLVEVHLPFKWKGGGRKIEEVQSLKQQLILKIGELQPNESLETATSKILSLISLICSFYGRAPEKAEYIVYTVRREHSIRVEATINLKHLVFP